MAAFTDHKDLRSASVNAKRDRTRRAKYNYFANTNEGALNTPHYVADVTINSTHNSAIDEWPVVDGLSKRQMFHLAQEATYCRHHHGPCPFKKAKSYVRDTEVRRGTRAAKKEAKEWERRRYDWDYKGQIDDDCLTELYLEWYERDAAPTEHESGFDVGPLLKKAEKDWVIGERRLMEKLGWIDAWDDEYWVSDSEGEWLDVDHEVERV